MGYLVSRIPGRELGGRLGREVRSRMQCRKAPGSVVSGGFKWSLDRSSLGVGLVADAAEVLGVWDVLPAAGVAVEAY